VQEPRRRYRVVQWATGNIGLHALGDVIRHPDLDLVGVYVYADTKAGRDAGDLCGAGPIGVAATRDLDQILAARPDCVLYMGDRPDVDTICRLLESGANVVSTRSEFHRPASMEPAVREGIEGACRRGKTSLHSTGSSPGFITEALPLVLSSLERRLDRLSIDEFADLSSRDSPEMLFGIMGFGRTPSQLDTARMAEYLKGSFAPSLGVLADAVGLPLDDVVATTRIAQARQRTTVAAGSVEAGTVAAECVEVTGLRHGHPFLQFRSHWYLTPDLDPAWDLRDTGWRVQVAGDLPLDIDIHFPVSPEQWAETSPGVTAHRPVNAVPYVCAAPPGILTTADLPQVVPVLTDGSSALP
jgi:2,4-diaminopentanoate dehydrogenase